MVRGDSLLEILNVSPDSSVASYLRIYVPGSWSDSTLGRVLSLHAVHLGSIPRIPCVSLILPELIPESLGIKIKINKHMLQLLELSTLTNNFNDMLISLDSHSQ